MTKIENVVVMKEERTDKSEHIESKQMVVDPFANLYGDRGLVKPIYSLELLLALKESNPIHSACIGAKVADIAGIGGYFSPIEEKRKNDKQYEQLESFMKYCNPEMTYNEILRAVWDDYETLGWGIIEVVRDGKGLPSEIYHMPAHTVRAHKDGIRFAQSMNEEFRWFKKFGYKKDFALETGNPLGEGASDDSKAGEVIVIRRFGSRSSYYGIPDYISSLGSIVGSQAVRDYNIEYFSGKTIPDAMLFLEGVDEVAPHVDQELKAFFASEVKGTHHKLAIVPVPEGAKAKLEKVTPEIKEASFRLYRQDNAIEICVAHRVPPYRIGWAITGSLGGTSAEEMNEMYKRSVIVPGQEILEHRLNVQLFRAFEEFIGKLDYEFKMNEIDIEDRMSDLDYAVKGYKEGLFKKNESRQIVGYDALDESENGFAIVQSSNEYPIRVNPQDIQKADENTKNALYDTYLNQHESMEKKLHGKVADFFGHRGNVS